MSERSPSEELLAALREAGVPKSVIAKKLVVAPSAVSALYSGMRTLKHDEAMKLRALLPEPATREVPLIGLSGAGKWLEAIEATRETITIPSNMAGKFAVEIVGDSVDLLMPEGSIAIIDPEDRDVKVGRLYLLMNADGEATIKRFRVDPARFEPVSNNPEYVPFLVGSFDFRVIGRVTSGMMRF